MIDKFKKILEKIKQRGNITLFAILKMDDLTDKWSLFLCAPWITEENRKEVFADVVKHLKDNMTTEELATVARVVISIKDDHLIQELLAFKNNDHIGGDSSVRLNGNRLNGNLIHDGYILESNKEA